MVAILEAPAPVQSSVVGLERCILDYLAEETVVGLDVLVETLPQYSWNQIFQAVDHLSRLERIVLRRHGFEYTLFSAHYAA